jgi:hypothetical protein
VPDASAGKEENEGVKWLERASASQRLVRVEARGYGRSLTCSRGTTTASSAVAKAEAPVMLAGRGRAASLSRLSNWPVAIWVGARFPASAARRPSIIHDGAPKVHGG